MAQGRSQNWKQAFCPQVHCTHHRAEESQVAVSAREKVTETRLLEQGATALQTQWSLKNVGGADHFRSPFQVCSLTPSKLIQIKKY